MTWSQSLRHDIEALFSHLSNVPDQSLLADLSIVRGDTGQDSMKQAKRLYAASPKGQAARARYETKRAQRRAKTRTQRRYRASAEGRAARERERQAARERAMIVPCPACGAEARSVCYAARGAVRKACHQERHALARKG